MNMTGNFVKNAAMILWLAGLALPGCPGTPGAAFGQAEHNSHAEDHSKEEHTHLEHPAETHGEHDEHGHEADGDHDEHGDEAEEHDHAAHADEEEGLRLSAEQRERFGIVIRTAGPGSLRNEISLPGEIVFNGDRVVHMAPRVAGIVRDVYKTVGDTVNTGELLAVIDSRELADAKSAYLAAAARTVLAEKRFIREKALHEKQVSSEEDFLEAEQALAESRIEERSARQKLDALGVPRQDILTPDGNDTGTITRYEIRSPIDGVITERHITPGESLEADADIFTIVDTGSVWVNLAVYIRNLPLVHVGQEVQLRADHSGALARGNIMMLTPFVEESTRSATARMVLDNSDGRWIPGTFVTGFISNSEDDLPVVVPRNAVQNIEGRDVVFVEHEGRFEMVPVAVGHSTRTHVEISRGLEQGTPYVSEGAFQLKATVVTSNLGSHAGHGH